MNVITQMGEMDINPESVVAVKKAPIMPEPVEFAELTYCVEFDDRFYSMGDNVVCISEADAEKLSELAGVEIEGKKKEIKSVKPQQAAGNGNGQKTIFVPFAKQLVLNEWERVFDKGVAWKKKDAPTASIQAKREPVPTPAPSSSSLSDGNRTLYEENQHPVSLIEQVFQGQYNCTECGRLVYDESRVCSGCIGGGWK